MDKLSIFKSRICEWFIDYVCVPFIVNYEKNNSELVGHFIKEFDKLVDYQKHKLSIDPIKRDMTKADVVRILSMISTCGNSGTSIQPIMSLVSKAIKYELMSPLTFEDSEWNEVSGNLYQNNRHASVFKENGKIRNIDALGWVIEKCVKLSDGKVLEFDYDNTIIQSGTAYVYDDVNGSWTPISSSAIIKCFDDYMGKTINVRAMEVYDDRDSSLNGVNVYTIILKRDIPSEFEKIYIPIDIREDSTAEEKFKKYVEDDLKFLEVENIKRFCHQPTTLKRSRLSSESILTQRTEADSD